MTDETLAEDGADAAGDARHDGAGGDCDETRHKGVFDEILSPAIPPGTDQENTTLEYRSFVLLLRFPVSRRRFVY